MHFFFDWDNMHDPLTVHAMDAALEYKYASLALRSIRTHLFAGFAPCTVHALLLLFLLRSSPPILSAQHCIRTQRAYQRIRLTSSSLEVHNYCRSFWTAGPDNVAAGSAGNVVATRLTEDPACSVLVIEAGIKSVCLDPPVVYTSDNPSTYSNAGLVSVAAPFLAPTNIPNSSVTWNYTTTPQDELNGRALSYSRGRVLGGSSSLSMLLTLFESGPEPCLRRLYDLYSRIQR